MEGDNQDKCQGSDGRRKRDAKVLSQFILHSTSLTVAGCDGCIGDEREIISKHGTADDRCNAKAREKPEVSDTAAAIGTIRVMVPTEVPMECRDKAGYHKENGDGKRPG